MSKSFIHACFMPLIFSASFFVVLNMSLFISLHKWYPLGEIRLPWRIFFFYSLRVCNLISRRWGKGKKMFLISSQLLAKSSKNKVYSVPILIFWWSYFFVFILLSDKILNEFIFIWAFQYLHRVLAKCHDSSFTNNLCFCVLAYTVFPWRVSATCS